MEHSDAAQVAALVGALGAAFVLLGRERVLPIAGLALLGAASALLGRSLVGDVELLLTSPAGIAIIAAGIAAAVLIAAPLTRYPEAAPVALLAVAPFRIPVGLGDEDAFLLLPLYLVLTASVIALASRCGGAARSVKKVWASILKRIETQCSAFCPNLFLSC